MFIQLRFALIAAVAAASLAACQSSSRSSAAPDQAAAAPAPAPAPTPAPAPVKTTDTPTATTSQQPAATLTRVADASLVCMVNDQFMNKPQIPVAVGGKTYFGCCPMCKDKLEQQAEARTSVDPVTGEAVDKATAVIAQDADGRVRYFASETNLATYNARL